jgi:hypothetical protein
MYGQEKWAHALGRPLRRLTALCSPSLPLRSAPLVGARAPRACSPPRGAQRWARRPRRCAPCPAPRWVVLGWDRWGKRAVGWAKGASGGRPGTEARRRRRHPGPGLGLAARRAASEGKEGACRGAARPRRAPRPPLTPLPLSSLPPFHGDTQALPFTNPSNPHSHPILVPRCASSAASWRTRSRW